MFLSLVITLATLLAVLLMLINVFITACYSMRSPAGSEAMGLVVPFIVSAIGGMILLIATWVGVGRGSFDWISTTPMVPFAVTSAITLGVAVAAVALLVAWAERMGKWVVPAGAICGGLGPVVVAGLIITSAWTPTDQMAASLWPWIAGGFTAVVASVGYGLGLYGLFKYLKLKGENQHRALAEHIKREAEWERKRNRAPLDALHEDFAEMSDTSPLWVFAGYLPMAHDQACRSFIIDRMLKVPDFESELARTIISKQPRYRHGCIDMMRFADQVPVQPTWSQLLAQSAKITTEEIAADPQWFKKVHGLNPLPKEYLLATEAAAARIEAASQMTPELKAAMEKLRQQVAAIGG